MIRGYVYILISIKDRKTYIGSTINLERRIKEHEKGLVSATRHRLPIKLIYKEEFEKISEARIRERYYKTHSGRSKLKLLLKKYFIAR